MHNNKNTDTEIQRINAVASGDTISGVLIYWDDTAVNDEGPAYRDGDESGAIELAGWGGPADGTEENTYHISDFFGADGRYRGPDRYGVYPVFSFNAPATARGDN